MEGTACTMAFMLRGLARLPRVSLIYSLSMGTAACSRPSFSSSHFLKILGEWACYPSLVCHPSQKERQLSQRPVFLLLVNSHGLHPARVGLGDIPCWGDQLNSRAFWSLLSVG